jgi:hypothetical protein
METPQIAIVSPREVVAWSVVREDGVGGYPFPIFLNRLFSFCFDIQVFIFRPNFGPIYKNLDAKTMLQHSICNLEILFLISNFSYFFNFRF